MTRLLPRLLVVAALAAVALTVSAAPAAAKSPCWSRVINDWYDNGRIDATYPVSCYQQALTHLPPDVAEYADAQDVIRAAMAVQIKKDAQSGKNGNGNNSNRTGGVVPPGKDGGSSGPSDPSSSSNPSGGPSGDNSSNGGIFRKALDRLGPGNANSIPIPLLVLGGLALLLLAAGAAGMVARKLQERRPQPATVPQRANDGPAV